MEMIPLSPERRAQLDNYAQRHGQNLATALDEGVATYLDWELQDYKEAVEGIKQGYADLFKTFKTGPPIGTMPSTYSD